MWKLARIVSESVTLDTQSNFLPPEASIEGASVDTKADIWMLGCTVHPSPLLLLFFSQSLL